MIAAGKVSEGCQLLCLINKALDACRYMQTYGQWHQAIWLAKSTLEEGDSAQVLKRYVDHLCSANVNLKSYAILVRNRNEALYPSYMYAGARSHALFRSTWKKQSQLICRFC